ncbi:LysR family transcriptional regulator [Pseudoponticoccus marisrubri]|uniref:LysR family transcriptional regulator n=1 Tax=Pseudoponticoccus marisrubri TaxID=1685382 RepID=A0A0W7WDX5_9RHOB|nr:LysR family transcriptional regulator [Pseudoponticoccus marisrubri]KUF08765.1 LysR family transcriptional regulator [Pseudoponticoccus marisrubri]
MAELNYNHLRYFQAVAHEGHLTRAAEKLNLSQSALSSQIKALEARLGHALFERRGRALHLTEAGRIALDHADVIFAAGRDLVDTLGQTGLVRRALRVGAEATLSRNFQMRFLAPVVGRSDTDLILQSGRLGELLEALGAHALDVVLSTVPPPAERPGGFTAHQVAQQPAAFVGTPGRVAGGLAEMLGREPLILPARGSAMRHGFDALADRLGLRCAVAAEIDDMAMMRLLARADAGVALVPPVVVADELSAGTLLAHPDPTGLTETFWAITRPRRFPHPLLRGLIADFA